jgi:hypothetical protein
MQGAQTGRQRERSTIRERYRGQGDVRFWPEAVIIAAPAGRYGVNR